jgi:hypothetical protein
LKIDVDERDDVLLHAGLGLESELMFSLLCVFPTRCACIREALHFLSFLSP